MESNSYKLVLTGDKDGKEHYMVMPNGLGESSVHDMLTVQEMYGRDSSMEFDDDDDNAFQRFRTITCGGTDYEYAPWGDDDMMPQKVIHLVRQNMITSRGMAFDITACYGQGLRFVNRDEKKTDTTDPDIRSFCLSNSIHECFMNQVTSMKYHAFTVTLITLNRDPDVRNLRIQRVSNLDSMYCRFEKTKDGRIGHVFFGHFHDGRIPDKAVAYECLDFTNPLGDLRVRLGLAPDPLTGLLREPTSQRTFAIVSRFPTPGYRYYPLPYYMSIFMDHWYDIYRLIGLGKKYMIQNTSAPRIQIEVHKDYWKSVCKAENITDPVKQAERIIKERQNIIDFVCGPENAGKAIVTHYYVDPNGKENRMVRITNLNEGGKKEGGDWTEDMSEASNVLCFALGVHPNLIGATPGKSQMNNSGSDKRELFTLKQAMEKPFHDIMAKPYHVILHFNGWADRYTVDVPMIELTTLDENKSSKKVTNTNDNGNGSEN